MTVILIERGLEAGSTAQDCVLIAVLGHFAFQVINVVEMDYFTLCRVRRQEVFVPLALGGRILRNLCSHDSVGIAGRFLSQEAHL